MSYVLLSLAEFRKAICVNRGLIVSDEFSCRGLSDRSIDEIDDAISSDTAKYFGLVGKEFERRSSDDVKDIERPKSFCMKPVDSKKAE